MGEHVLPGNPPVAITLRRSGRARRISLKVSGVDGRVTLTLPQHIPEKEGLAFAQEKSDWLRKHLDKQPELDQVGVGTDLPVEGKFLTIAQGNIPQIVKEGSKLCVPGAADAVAARVLGWLKVQARERLVQTSDHFAAQLGKNYTRITLRDTRSRWGSCTDRGGLMYSWRLILAPPEVLSYVAAHEVAHLVEMNHSKRFWDTVARICPDYEDPKAWLRHNGAALHRYRF